jgi:hypothetical protein
MDNYWFNMLYAICNSFDTNLDSKHHCTNGLNKTKSAKAAKILLEASNTLKNIATTKY